MTVLALADGSFIFIGILIVALIGITFAYYSVKGSGINQHGWSDRDRAFGTFPGKDPTSDVRTWGRGSASSQHGRRRSTPLEQRTAEAIAQAAGADRDPTWRARIGESVQLQPLVDLSRDWLRGDDGADVVLVEYGEYSCRFCRDAEVAMRKIEQRADARVQRVFRHFPQTSVHPEARDAALAAEAAGRQGRFWEMHDLLAGSKKQLTKAHIGELADRAGLDRERFRTDLADPELGARVDEDLASGLRSGVNGTPTIYINNVRYDDDTNVDELTQAIEVAREVAANQPPA